MVSLFETDDSEPWLQPLPPYDNPRKTRDGGFKIVLLELPFPYVGGSNLLRTGTGCLGSGSASAKEQQMKAMNDVAKYMLIASNS